MKPLAKFCAGLALAGFCGTANAADNAGHLKTYNADTKTTTFQGAESLEAEPHANSATESGLVLAPGPKFHNGTIELQIAGEVAPGADPGARGFVGVAFRVTGEHQCEAFYLRPTNGRAGDQLRRNHSLQYISPPDYPWERLRAETPGQYESYADIEPGVWTKIRIEVEGAKAKLYVNGAGQPSLIVNDLKHGDSSGAIAYWVGPKAIGHFRDLKIVPD